jgi:cell division protein FtsI (penicillin-binding protein 3)
MAMALDAGITDLDEEFPVQNSLKIRGKLISDDHYSANPLNMSGIMRESSNRGTALMALRAGADVQQSFFKTLGLFDRVSYGLSESASPQLQSEWQDLTVATVSYGHGMAVTPLALTVAMGAILNDGVYVEPTILKRDGINTPQTRRVVSSETSKTVRDLMRYVATDGTGRNAAVSGYDVMGKTGTADKPSVGGYDETRLVTSFIAAFPYHDPEYAVFITFDEPKRAAGQPRATAGWNAAPTAGRVIERIAPILGVSRNVEDTALSPFSVEEALP